MAGKAEQQRHTQAEPAETPAVSAAPCVVTVTWAGDALVCVTIVDAPAPQPSSQYCLCGGCQAAQHADWAARFLAE